MGSEGEIEGYGCPFGRSFEIELREVTLEQAFGLPPASASGILTLRDTETPQDEIDAAVAEFCID